MVAVAAVAAVAREWPRTTNYVAGTSLVARGGASLHATGVVIPIGDVKSPWPEAATALARGRVGEVHGCLSLLHCITKQGSYHMMHDITFHSSSSACSADADTDFASAAEVEFGKVLLDTVRRILWL